MEPTFRASMGWLHTWAGVVVGALLFAIFWMGTLSVFDREIDRWMKPSTRALPADTAVDFDALWKNAGPAPGTSQWSVTLPTERAPMLRMRHRGADGKFVQTWHDPRTGAKLPDAGTLGATEFLYPFHYNLHLKIWDIGYWLVGFAGMTMLVMLVSGVIIHRSIFADFFSFRPRKKPRRALLDLHTVCGVLVLPFHAAITLSGLIIFIAIYFPGVQQVAYDGAKAGFNKEAYGTDVYARPKANRPGSQGSLGDLVEKGRQHWGGTGPFFVRVWHPGDANAYVELRRSFDDEVTLNRDSLYFDAASGRLLHDFTTKPVVTAQRFIAGLHSIHFRHWALRWLYFVLGLAGCAMIATGFLFWLESRRRRHAEQGRAGVRLVEGLTIGATTGIVLATLAFFLANRVLPLDLAHRADAEIRVFYIVWLAAFAHAWLRPRRAWSDQCWALAVAAMAAVALNAVTTGDHLLRTLAGGQWAVAGMDLMLLAGAAVAALTALKLQRRRMVPAVSATAMEKRHA